MDDVVSVLSPFGEVVATGIFDGVRNSIAIDLYIDGVGTIPIVVVEVDIDETEVPAGIRTYVWNDERNLDFSHKIEHSFMTEEERNEYYGK